MSFVEQLADQQRRDRMVGYDYIPEFYPCTSILEHARRDLRVWS